MEKKSQFAGLLLMTACLLEEVHRLAALLSSPKPVDDGGVQACFRFISQSVELT